MPRLKSKAQRSKRDLLIDAALELFYVQGYQATGIDQIIDRAGIAKMTLYSNFASKDQLLLAVLDRLDQRLQADLITMVEAADDDARSRLLVMFDLLEQVVEAPGFSGCLFVNIAAEFGDRAHPIHQAAAAHKRALASHMARLAAEGGIDRPDELAEQLLVLFDGAIVDAHVCGRSCTESTRRMAEVIIDDALEGVAVAQP